jgi:hypothetical protein
VLDQFDFVRGKAGDGYGDPVLVFALLLDIVRRPVGANVLVEQSKRRSKPTVER